MEEENQLLLDRIMSKTSPHCEDFNFLWNDENSSDEEREQLPEAKCSNSWESFRKFVSIKRGKIFLILSALFLAAGDGLSVVVIKETSNPFGVILVTKLTVCVSCIFKLCYTGTSFLESLRKEQVALTIRGILGGNAITLQLIAYNFISFAVETTIKSTLILVSGLVGWIILRERMTATDCILAIFCIIGVTIIAKPFAVFTINSANENEDKMKREYFVMILGVVLSLGDAAFSGIAVALSRLLNKRGIDTDVIVFCGVVYSLPIDITCCILYRSSPLTFSLRQLLYMLICGLFRYAAFFFSTLLCLYEKCTISSLVFPISAVLEFPIQLVFLKIMPSWNTFLGAGIILPCMVLAVVVKSENVTSPH